MRSQRTNAIISILFVVFGGPAFVLVYVPWWLTRFRLPHNEPYWQRALALAVIALGIVPVLESAARFVRVGKGTLVPTAAPERLVVGGLYRYVRNPMYAGVTVCLAAEVMLFRSSALAWELALALIAMNLFVRLYEERKLSRRYGEAYAEFKRNVPRWLPRLSPWSGTRSQP